MRLLVAPIVLALCFATAIAADLPPGHPAVAEKKPAQAAPATQLPQKGKVLNVIDVPSYTYMEVAQDKKKIWFAAPTVTVKKGDTVSFQEGMLMTNFHSKTLNRDFPIISFVGQVVVVKE